MAGVSAAAHLAPHGTVTLLESESALAYHTTGRSAAVFVVNYGAAGTRPLAAASHGFLATPPEGSTDTPLLTDRGVLWIANPEQAPHLEAMAAEPAIPGHEVRLIDADAAREMVPVLGDIAGAVHEPSALDIDVAGLHQAFVRIARANRAAIRTNSPVTKLGKRVGGWMVEAGGETIECDVVVNAAGAWGDEIAAIAGIPPIGLQPMRRTAFMVPGDLTYAEWPMVIDAGHGFYFKPDGAQILCSLAEEEPCHPCDPRPRMEDVALAIDRINEATTLDIRTVNSQWTGLRTFSPDREMVIGPEPEAPGFYWLVGQGGMGIATSPGYGALIASQVIGADLPAELVTAGFDPAVTAPARFRV